MSSKPLDCAEIRAGFSRGGVPNGPEVENHLRSCAACRELFESDARLGRQLAEAALPPPPLGTDGLFELLDRDVTADTGLRARLRGLPTPLRLMACFGFAVAIVAWHGLMRPREALGQPYSPVALWVLLLALLGGLFYGTRWLLLGPSSASARRTHVTLLLLGLPAIIALLSPLGALHAPEALAAWGSPGVCFSYGALGALPLLALYWLFERRDQMPVAALVSAGALSGIAANALLHCHCASANLPHLLLGHATIGLAWALVLGGAASLRPARAR